MRIFSAFMITLLLSVVGCYFFLPPFTHLVRFGLLKMEWVPQSPLTAIIDEIKESTIILSSQTPSQKTLDSAKLLYESMVKQKSDLKTEEDKIQADYKNLEVQFLAQKPGSDRNETVIEDYFKTSIERTESNLKKFGRLKSYTAIALGKELSIASFIGGPGKLKESIPKLIDSIRIFGGIEFPKMDTLTWVDLVQIKKGQDELRTLLSESKNLSDTNKKMALELIDHLTIVRKFIDGAPAFEISHADFPGLVIYLTFIGRTQVIYSSHLGIFKELLHQALGRTTGQALNNALQTEVMSDTDFGSLKIRLQPLLASFPLLNMFTGKAADGLKEITFKLNVSDLFQFTLAGTFEKPKDVEPAMAFITDLQKKQAEKVKTKDLDAQELHQWLISHLKQTNDGVHLQYQFSTAFSEISSLLEKTTQRKKEELLQDHQRFQAIQDFKNKSGARKLDLQLIPGRKPPILSTDEMVAPASSSKKVISVSLVMSASCPIERSLTIQFDSKPVMKLSLKPELPSAVMAQNTYTFRNPNLETVLLQLSRLDLSKKAILNLKTDEPIGNGMMAIAAMKNQLPSACTIPFAPFLLVQEK